MHGVRLAKVGARTRASVLFYMCIAYIFLSSNILLVIEIFMLNKITTTWR